MSQYADDGGVIPAGISIRDYEEPDKHLNQFGLYKGRIVKKILPEDKEPDNSMKDRIEYVVRVNGQDYAKAIDIRNIGGVFGHHEITRSETTVELDKEKLEDKTYSEKTDGEMVWVMFIGGNGDYPIIIGSGEHPANKEYRKQNGKDPESLKDKAPYELKEFHGVEFFIDKDSNYSIEMVGQKDINSDRQDREILNPDGVTSKVTFFGNGDYKILTTDGREEPEGDPDPDKEVSMTFTKAEKKWETLVQKNKMTFDENGVKVTDKNENDMTMNEDGIEIVDKNSNIVTMDDTGIEVVDKNANSTVMESTGITITDANGQTVTMGPTGVKIEALTTQFEADTPLVKLGTAAVFHAALAESVIAYNDTHSHIAPQAPGGAIPTLVPTVPMVAKAGTALDVTALFIFVRGNV